MHDIVAVITMFVLVGCVWVVFAWFCLIVCLVLVGFVVVGFTGGFWGGLGD